MLDVRDMWAESLSTTSLAKIPGFIKFNLFLEKFLFNRADLIICTSRAQVRTVKEMTKGQIPVSFVPNGIDPDLKSLDSNVNPMIKDIKAEFDYIVMFAGKHSNYTALESVLPAAEKLAAEKVAFLFVGGGYTKKRLIECSAEMALSNVFFHDQVSKKDLSSFLAGADIFLINYSNSEAWEKVLPNKLFDYLYWNKPIIASVVEGEITATVREAGAGVCISPENPDEMVLAVKEIIKNGKKNPDTRKFVLNNYDREKTVKLFVENYRKLLD